MPPPRAVLLVVSLAISVAVLAQDCDDEETDLMNAIDTAGGLSQIRMEIKMTGTQFGVKPPGTPMPRTINLQNDGFKCPSPTRKGMNTTSICDEQRRNLS